MLLQRQSLGSRGCVGASTSTSHPRLLAALPSRRPALASQCRSHKEECEIPSTSTPSHLLDHQTHSRGQHRWIPANALSQLNAKATSMRSQGSAGEQGQAGMGSTAPSTAGAEGPAPNWPLLFCSVLGSSMLLALPSMAGPLQGLLPEAGPLEQAVFVAEALGVLAAIVAVHEAGHFTAARSLGIHVTKFAIGFGPPLLAFEREGVEYSLRLVPLGGYVAFPDDDPESKFDKDDPDLLRNRSIRDRTIVISAGVIANILFAYTSLFVQVGTVGKAETAYNPGVIVPKVTPSSVAARAGFQSGDLILKVDGQVVAASPDQVSRVVGLIKASPERAMAFTVQRKDAPDLVTVTATPELAPDGKGRIGVQLVSNAYISHTKASSPQELYTIATGEFNRLAGTVLDGLRRIITNFGGVAGQISGPVAIVAAGSEIARTDSAGLFQFCAIVNINLAIVNLLPLPALDGGYLALLAVEAARGGQKLPEKFEQGFMASGLLLLMAMGFGLVIKDTINLLPL